MRTNDNVEVIIFCGDSTNQSQRIELVNWVVMTMQKIVDMQREDPFLMFCQVFKNGPTIYLS
jgi:hypothetical protein